MQVSAMTYAAIVSLIFAPLAAAIVVVALGSTRTRRPAGSRESNR
jgi:hypothetical protein